MIISSVYLNKNRGSLASKLLIYLEKNTLKHAWVGNNTFLTICHPLVYTGFCQWSNQTALRIKAWDCRPFELEDAVKQNGLQINGLSEVEFTSSGLPDQAQSVAGLMHDWSHPQSYADSSQDAE